MDDFNLIRLAFTINVVVDQLGAVLFIAMVYVICKYRKLHDIPCLKMIGMFMFCCLCSKFIILFPYLVRVVPLTNVPLVACVAIQMVPYAFLNDIMPVTVAIGFDRLLSIFFPIWYCVARKRFYFFFVCIALLLYPVYLASYMVIHVIDDPFIQTNCTSDELYGPNKKPFDYNWNFNYTAIGLYTIMALKLWWTGREGRREYFAKHPIFKSFAIILAIQVLGQWAIMLAYGKIPKLFNGLSENQIPLVYFGINCFSSLVTTAEFAGIYYTSSEHRNALLKEFPRLFRYFPGSKASVRVANGSPSYVKAMAALNVRVVDVHDRNTK